MNDTEINPIHLREDFRERYGRYLRTALPVSDRFPKLKEAVRSGLNQQERIVKGPSLETLPDFEKGTSLRDLVKEGLLHEGFLNLSGPLLDRPLHSHQEAAFRRILVEGHNVVVATGTGSGKTECFLVPLIHSLLKDHDEGNLGLGVRAVIVYPMNALANDQLYHRIAPWLCGPFKEFGITFGRFTGQTPPGKSRNELAPEILGRPFFKKELGWQDVPGD